MTRAELKFVVPLIVMSVNAVLWLWALVGLIEWLVGPLFWMPISNPELPRNILLLQWILCLAVPTILFVGFATRWHLTPVAAVVGYALMAMLCAVETFGYMTNESRFLAIAIEYTTYIIFGLLLFQHGYFKERFTGAGNSDLQQAT